MIREILAFKKIFKKSACLTQKKSLRKWAALGRVGTKHILKYIYIGILEKRLDYRRQSEVPFPAINTFFSLKFNVFFRFSVIFLYEKKKSQKLIFLLINFLYLFHEAKRINWFQYKDNKWEFFEENQFLLKKMGKNRVMNVQGAENAPPPKNVPLKLTKSLLFIYQNTSNTLISPKYDIS